VNSLKGLLMATRRAEGSAPPTPIAQLARVGNRSLLDRALDDLRSAGARSVGMVVTPDTRHAVEQAVAAAGDAALDVEWVEVAGDVDGARALIAAADFIGDDPVALHRGDQLLGGALADAVGEYRRDELDGVVVLAESALAQSALHDRRLTRLLQLAPLGAGAVEHTLTGVYVLGPAVVRRLIEMDHDEGGKLELDAAVSHVVGTGCRVASHVAEDWWRWSGELGDLLEGNRIALSALRRRPVHAHLAEAQIQGPVEVHPTARIESTLVRGPAVIGARARISNGYIGPYTAVGDDVTIEDAEIEHSIVLPGARIECVSRRLEGSVIGAGARVFSDFGLPKALRLRVGDRAEVCLA
jgi:glucose-1-phosphate thymidylyltransferase